MKDFAKRLFICQIILMLPFILTGVKGESSKKLKLINIGTPSIQSMNSAPFIMGMKKGFYPNEGLKVEMMQMRPNIISPSLMAEEIDYTTAAGTTIKASASGLPFKIVFIIGKSLPHSLFAQPEIKTVKELKGKVIGVAAVGTSEHYALRLILKLYGLDPDRDVTVITIGPDMGVQALMVKSVNAAMAAAVASVHGQQKGYRRLARVADVVEMLSIGISTTDKKIREKPDEVKRMIRGTLKSMDYIKGNKKEVMDLMIKEWGLEKETADEVYESGVRGYSKDGTIGEKAIIDAIAMGRDLGMKVSENIPISKVADFSLLKEVHKELGLSR